ncbi:MAG: GatB/YqeY domain-containing protein [Candidatus Uhrbacteria bacterium]|nr:GatB/YqeY domain-containing protein [Candidatus Uhrbacteria bacterium]
MTLAERIIENMKAAMKAKDSATLSTLRLLISAMKNKKIDVQHELSDAEVTDVVKTQVKQLKDSIESFTAGGREDLAASVQVEIGVLEQYLPAQMSDEELTRIVKNAVEKSGATSKADMGKVMGAAMAAVAGRADGTRVKEIVGSLLAGFVFVVVGLSFAQETFAAAPLFETFSSNSTSFEFFLRIMRVLVLWLGVFAMVAILVGGFTYMKASYRDDEHVKALTYITKGMLVSIVIFLVFSFCTIVLQKI